MLHAELASSPVRVSGLQPGPMRTPLRSRAYADDTDVALGSDIMTASLKGYALLKLIGDGLGLDGLCRDLGRRFGRKRRVRGETAATTA